MEIRIGDVIETCNKEYGKVIKINHKDKTVLTENFKTYKKWDIEQIRREAKDPIEELGYTRKIGLGNNALYTKYQKIYNNFDKSEKEYCIEIELSVTNKKIIKTINESLWGKKELCDINFEELEAIYKRIKELKNQSDEVMI